MRKRKFIQKTSKPKELRNDYPAFFRQLWAANKELKEHVTHKGKLEKALIVQLQYKMPFIRHDIAAEKRSQINSTNKAVRSFSDFLVAPGIRTTFIQFLYKSDVARLLLSSKIMWESKHFIGEIISVRTADRNDYVCRLLQFATIDTIREKEAHKNVKGFALVSSFSYNIPIIKAKCQVLALVDLDTWGNIIPGEVRHPFKGLFIGRTKTSCISESKLKLSMLDFIQKHNAKVEVLVVGLSHINMQRLGSFPWPNLHLLVIAGERATKPSKKKKKKKNKDKKAPLPLIPICPLTPENFPKLRTVQVLNRMWSKETCTKFTKDIPEVRVKKIDLNKRKPTWDVLKFIFMNHATYIQENKPRARAPAKKKPRKKRTRVERDKSDKESEVDEEKEEANDSDNEPAADGGSSTEEEDPEASHRGEETEPEEEEKANYAVLFSR